MDEHSESPIEHLGLSTRAYNSLKNAGIDTIGELAELTELDLLSLRNLGAKSMAEINETMRRLVVHGRAFLAKGGQISHAPSSRSPELSKGCPAAGGLGTTIEHLSLSTRAYNSLKNAGIDTIAELAELTELDLLEIRNLGAKSIAEIIESLQGIGVEGHASLAEVDRGQSRRPMTQRQMKRARKDATSEAVLEAVRARSGQAVAVKQVHDAVNDLLEFIPEEDEVVECLRMHAKETEFFVKVARDAYAWAPDGNIPPPPTPPHVAAMIDKRWRGDTLGEIGAAHGVTRERVRQLLEKYGGPTAADVRERRAARELEEQRERVDALEAEVRAALGQRGPMTVTEVAEFTGYDPVEVSKHWPRDLHYLRLHGSGNYETQWSDEAILEAIRDASLYEFPLTTNAYGELLSQGQVLGPSIPRISQRFGSWTAACEAAGVVPGQTMRPHYESRWSDDDLLRIARQYLLDPSAPNSAGRFDEWRRTAVPDGPSFQTLRNRFGSWTEVKRRALARGSEDS